MKKILFISNITNRISNFSIPSIEASQHMGYEFHMAANLSGFSDENKEYDVKLHHIDLVRNPFSLANIRAYKQILKLVDEEQFDAIHCNTPIGGVFGRFSGRKKKIRKVIYTAHGFHFYKGAPLKNRVFFKLAELWMAHYTDAILTINQEDFTAAQKFRLKSGGQVYYLPGVGIDVKKFRPVYIDVKEYRDSFSLTEKSVVLIAVGDLIKRKNYDDSIKAIGLSNNPDLHLLICGVGPELNHLKALTKNLELENQIHFLGFRTDIVELLSFSDLFILSSLQEGLPRVLMEAMASGLPCIVSKIRGNTDLIEDGIGGYTVKPNDVMGYSNAINHLTSHKKLRHEMSEINLEASKKLDAVNIKSKMAEIYFEVLTK